MIIRHLSPFITIYCDLPPYIPFNSHLLLTQYKAKCPPKWPKLSCASCSHILVYTNHLGLVEINRKPRYAASDARRLSPVLRCSFGSHRNAQLFLLALCYFQAARGSPQNAEHDVGRLFPSRTDFLPTSRMKPPISEPHGRAPFVAASFMSRTGCSPAGTL